MYPMSNMDIQGIFVTYLEYPKNMLEIFSNIFLWTLIFLKISVKLLLKDLVDSNFLCMSFQGIYTTLSALWAGLEFPNGYSCSILECFVIPCSLHSKY